MASNVGELKIALSFDGNSFKASQKEVEQETKNWGSKLAGGVGKVGKAAGKALAAGMAAGSAAVVAIVKQATSSFAEYEQLVGGVETLFKSSSDEVMKYASRAFETAGVSANEYMNTVTSFSASLLQSVGGNTSKAAKLADQAVIDMADNANKMGTSMEAIQNAYQGFAKQNFTMLDNLKLGYGGTRGEMERLLKDAEKLTGKKFDVSNFADITEAIHAIQVNMGIAGTTAKEGTETISGSLNALKAAWQNVLTGIVDGSQDLPKLIDNLVSSAGNFAKNMLPAVEGALKGVVQLIKELAPSIVKELPKLVKELLPAIIQAAAGLVQALAEALPDIISGLIDAVSANIDTILEAIMTGLMSLLDRLPEIIQNLFTFLMTLAQAVIAYIPQILPQIVQAVMGIIVMLTAPENIQALLNAGIMLFMALVQAIPQIIIALINAVPDIIMNLINFFTDPSTIMMIIKAAVQLFMGLVQAVPQILGALFGAFGSLFTKLWNKLKTTFGSFVGKFGEFLSGIFKGAINGVLGFIEGFVNAPINIINGFIGAINGAFGIIGIHLDTIATIQLPRLAEGGYAGAGASTAIIGEEGKEVVLPLENNTDNWSGLLASALAEKFNEGESGVGGGITIENQNFNISNQLDAENIGHIMMQSIRRQAR